MTSASIVLLIIVAALYFTPSIIAIMRKKTNMAPIIIIDILLGWTFVGWVVALVWAAAAEKTPQTVIVNNYGDSSKE
jgi:hypothetical protein